MSNVDCHAGALRAAPWTFAGATCMQDVLVEKSLQIHKAMQYMQVPHTDGAGPGLEDLGYNVTFSNMS